MQRPQDKPILYKPEEPVEERTYVFENPSKAEEEPKEKVSNLDDEFAIGNEISADQIINEEGLMEVRKTKERLEQQARERKREIRQRIDTLTPEELDVMQKMVAGMLNKVIAGEMLISLRTVETRRHRVFEKMQVGSLAELVRMVVEAGD